MSLTSSCELSGHIVVKTDRTSGYDANAAKEVVFMGIAFSDASAEQPASDAGADLVDSDEPSCCTGCTTGSSERPSRIVRMY